MELGGYVASDYLKKEGEVTPEEPSTTPEPDIKNDNYKVEESKLIIAPGTTIEQLEGAVLEGSTLGTGAKITVNGTTYTLVVLGDISGDGSADARDSARILKYSVGQYELSEEQKKAADINNDGEVDARDSARILKYSVNAYDITL